MSALVVGCGSGREAAVVASECGCNVASIDLNGNFGLHATKLVELKVSHASALDLGDESFDVVSSVRLTFE
jgi:ubiquinone/menaquinone biosynthesis C-methylase UbiE